MSKTARQDLLKGVLFMKKKNEWKEYFAVFSDTTHQLRLFKSAEIYVMKKEPRYVITIPGFTSKAIYEEDQGFTSVFKLSKQDEEYVLAAVDEEDRHKWLLAFEDVSFDGKMQI